MDIAHTVLTVQTTETGGERLVHRDESMMVACCVSYIWIPLRQDKEAARSINRRNLSCLPNPAIEFSWRRYLDSRQDVREGGSEQWDHRPCCLLYLHIFLEPCLSTLKFTTSWDLLVMWYGIVRSNWSMILKLIALMYVFTSVWANRYFQTDAYRLSGNDLA